MSISVLVVEDNAELKAQIRDFLSQRGYDVRCAINVEEAVSTLNEMPTPCLVLWDPVTLQINALLVAHLGRRGVRIATIPVGVTSTGLAADGSPTITKKLTSREAILSVVREHCPEVGHQTTP